MEQKNYKAIAEIISTTSGISRGSGNNMCDRLACYFEREFKEDLSRTEERFKEYKKRYGFDKEQFIKGCGVE